MIGSSHIGSGVIGSTSRGGQRVLLDAAIAVLSFVLPQASVSMPLQAQAATLVAESPAAQVEVAPISLNASPATLSITTPSGTVLQFVQASDAQIVFSSPATGLAALVYANSIALQAQSPEASRIIHPHSITAGIAASFSTLPPATIFISPRLLNVGVGTLVVSSPRAGMDASVIEVPFLNRGPGFVVGHIVMVKERDFNELGQLSTVYQIVGEVTGFGVKPNGEEYALVQVIVGKEYIGLIQGRDVNWIAIGHKTDPTLANIIRMTSGDVNSPFIDLRSGVTSWERFGSLDTLLLRIGQLTGITHPIFGALSGSGFYGKNVYLEGNMVLGPLSTISWAGVTGPNRPQDNATVGADWLSNVANRPSNLVALGDLPGYIQSTKITSTTIEAPILAGNTVLGGAIIASLGGSNTAGMTGEGSGEGAVRIWAGATYSDRENASFKVTQGGDVFAGSLKASTATTGERLAFGLAGNAYFQMFDASGLVLTVFPHGSNRRPVFQNPVNDEFQFGAVVINFGEVMYTLAAQFGSLVIDSLTYMNQFVSFGPNDSGGTGYRVLRVPNA